MTRKQAILAFGSVIALARALGCTTQAIYKMSKTKPLSPRVEKAVRGAIAMRDAAANPK